MTEYSVTRFSDGSVLIKPVVAAGGGGGCGCLILAFLGWGLAYEAYQWFLGILPTLMFIGGCIIGALLV